jgi:hypothetical protein
MGMTLNEIYKIVTDKAGFKGRMRLAVRTGVSRTRAEEMPDTPEIISKFKKEADEILGQDIDKFLKGGN